MKKNLIWHLLTVVAVAVPSLYLWHVWPLLPAQVPTHFGINGQADGFTSREHLWFLTLALPLGTALLFSVLPRLDPKQRLDSESANFQKLRLATVALLSSLACYCLYLGAHTGATPGRGLMVLLGIFLVFLGNYLTTVQPNYFVGIRTPWTLESPTVWARTHRLGGIAFCLSGVLLMVLPFLLPAAWAFAILPVLLLATTAFSAGYSYWLFRKEQQPSSAS